MSDKAINLETLGMVGCVNGLKSACTQLGCFGMRNLNDGKESLAGQKGSASRASSQTTWGRSQTASFQGAPSGSALPQQGAGEDEEKSFYVCRKAKDGGKDKNGRQIFILPCHEIVDGKSLEQESEIIFYPNVYKDPARLTRITQWNGIPTRYRFLVKRIAPQSQKNRDAYSAYTFRGFIGE